MNAELPPLYLNPTWNTPQLPRPRATGYKINHAIKGDNDSTLTFPNPICGCLSIQDTGLNCFCAHCCCGPCIYDSAMRYAGIKGSGTAAVATVFAQNLPDSSDGGNAALKGAAQAAAAYARARVRQNLIAKFYPEGASEGFVWSVFYHACCVSCAWCQEVDAVMVWSQEVKGKQIFYGSAQDCKCAQLVDGNGRFVYQNQVTIPPTVGVMERV